MTNPVTQHLLEQLNDQDIQTLVEHFDVLEVMIIQIYKSKQATRKDERLFKRVKRWMNKHYSTWQPQLESYWRNTIINNEPLTKDPFLALIVPERAATFTDNWELMQTIPPARQALNEWLLDLIEERTQ